MTKRPEQPGSEEPMSKSTPTPRQRLIAELRERKRMEVVYDGVGRSHWECRHDHHDDLCQRAAREIEALSELVQEALRDAQDCATEARWQERQGEDYGSY